MAEYDTGYDDDTGEEVENYLGDEMSGEYDTGAAPRRRHGTRRGMMVPRRLKSPPPMAGGRPGLGRLARKREPLGLGVFVFNSTTTTSFTFEVEPQRDFQPERLILEVAHTSATDGATVDVSEIFVGDNPQIPLRGKIPAIMFAHDAVGAGVDFSVCPGGIKLIVTVEISVPLTGTDQISVAAGFYGAVVGQ